MCPGDPIGWNGLWSRRDIIIFTTVTTRPTTMRIFGVTFTIWDRLFGTYVNPDDGQGALSFGIGEKVPLVRLAPVSKRRRLWCSKRRVEPVHLKHRPILEPYSRQLPAPDTSAIDRQEIGLDAESQRSPVAADERDIHLASMWDTEPREDTRRVPAPEDR